MTKVRDPFFDVTKALAIMLVLFGHSMHFAPIGLFSPVVRNFIVGMNMPIFFLISGYFAWNLIESGDWRKLGKTVRCYFAPALFVGVLATGIDLLSGNLALNIVKISKCLLFEVFVVPWFLTTLAECLVLTFVAHLVSRKHCGWTVLCLLLIVAAILCRPSFIHGTQSFSSIINMLPIFVVGGMVFRRCSLKPWENPIIGVACLVAFLLVVFFEGNVDTNGMSFYKADSAWGAFKAPEGVLTFFARPLVGIAGSLGCMSAVYWGLKLIPSLSCLAKIGTLTLGIYVFHLWPLRQLEKAGLRVDMHWGVVGIALLFILVFTLLTWLLQEKTGRYHKFIWGK